MIKQIELKTTNNIRKTMILEPHEIKKHRKQLNMSQKKLAEKAGTTQPNLAKIENENTNPSYQLLKKISNILLEKEDHLLDPKKNLKKIQKYEYECPKCSYEVKKENKEKVLMLARNHIRKTH